MEKLHHQASESFEGSWYSNSWTDFDEDAFCCMYEDLELSSLVDGGVEEREEALR